MDERVCHGGDVEVRNYEHVDQQQDEELTVPKADAVVDPRAVVVHVQHATVARRAVMAPLWFKDIAHQTIPSSLVLRVAQVKAPKHRHLPRVCRHCLHEGPYQHDKENVENGKQGEHFDVVYKM
jgi:hypothetical protein